MNFIGVRQRPLIRDTRLFTVVRLLGAIVFVVAYHDLGLERLEVILSCVAVGVCAQVIASLGRDSLRSVAFEVALAADVVVLSVALHVTGGLASPVQPIVGLWAVLAVVGHGSNGGLAWCVAMLFGVYGIGLVTRVFNIDQLGSDLSPTLVVSSLVALVATAVGAEYAARQVERARRSLESLASRDPLTGLQNRRNFDERLGAVMSSAHRKAGSATLAILDVDHFKQLNDRHGHPSGDQALRHLANILVHSTRIEDECFRIGGDEFAIIMPDCSADVAAAALRRVRAKLAETTTDSDTLTISCGYADIASMSDPAAIIARADAALYAAKKAGRNTDRTLP